MSSSSHLHVIKPHIKTIANVMNNPVYKQAIRAGGMNAGIAQMATRKILSAVQKEDPDLMSNAFKKDVLKSIVHGLTAGANKPVRSEKVEKAIHAANIARRREANAEELSGPGHHAVSAADLVRQGHQNSAITGYTQGIRGAENNAQNPGQQHGAGTIADIMKKHTPTPPSSGSSTRPGGLPPRLAI
jgi:hypothetical protein